MADSPKTVTLNAIDLKAAAISYVSGVYGPDWHATAPARLAQVYDATKKENVISVEVTMQHTPVQEKTSEATAVEALRLAVAKVNEMAADLIADGVSVRYGTETFRAEDMPDGDFLTVNMSRPL